MYEDLKELLGREVDLITEGGLLPFARESAERDKILIYERES
jgi:predicted nucleotidyltransferase